MAVVAAAVVIVYGIRSKPRRRKYMAVRVSVWVCRCVDVCTFACVCECVFVCMRVCVCEQLHVTVCLCVCVRVLECMCK